MKVTRWLKKNQGLLWIVAGATFVGWYLMKKKQDQAALKALAVQQQQPLVQSPYPYVEM